MITFSNGRKAQYFVASGALAFDGKGWWWERPLVWLGFIDRSLFAIVLKSLTLDPRKGNLRWWKPWTCVRLIKGGAVNKVGLTNKGFEWWLENVAPKLDFNRYTFIVSLYGTIKEIEYMIMSCNHLDISGFELNWSCPNTGHANEQTDYIIRGTKQMRAVTHKSLFIKLGADQDGVTIARNLKGIISGISFNTLVWHKVFPDKRTPLHKLEAKVSGGGGGVSGKELQKYNWPFMEQIHKAVPEVPLIASSIMEKDDIGKVRLLGASAVSFGTIHLPDHKWWLRPWTIFTNPCKATKIARADSQERYSDWLSSDDEKWDDVLI